MNGAVGYIYDAVGNRTQMASTLAPIAAGLFNYDANDRFSAGDTVVHPERSRRNNNGNTTSSGGIANVYDFENHLVQHCGVTVVYDGDGNRVAKTVAGMTTQYLVDDRNPTGYAQVIDELQSGAVTRTYTWGLELIAQTRPQPSPAPALVSFYVYDGHGSVRALTDATGNLTDTYDVACPERSRRDAFGNLTHSTGSTPNVYLFAGEQFDPDLHLYYNRARYLNVSTGRFWTMDTAEGDDNEPLSLHKYLYASNDPVDLVDPTGNQGYAETVATLPINSVIVGLAVLSLVGVCGAFAVVLHGPGFCGSKYEPLTLYRGLGSRGDRQIRPEYFLGDGLSLYEQLFPRSGLRLKLPVEIDYFEPKTPGTQAAHIFFPPGLAVIGDITYTPEYEDPAIGKGHWSLQVKGGVAVNLIVEFLRYFLDNALPF